MSLFDNSKAVKRIVFRENDTAGPKHSTSGETNSHNMQRARKRGGGAAGAKVGHFEKCQLLVRSTKVSLFNGSKAAKRTVFDENYPASKKINNGRN